LFEYVLVAGWHAGITSTTTSVHVYFLPAGVGLLGAVAGGSYAFGRARGSLMRRMAWAERARWGRPDSIPSDLPNAVQSRVDFGRLWIKLTCLQLGIWVIQENLETVAAGHRPPWMGVLTGVHVLAPLVEAEVALFLASLYYLLRRHLVRLEESVRLIEEFVARRWARVQGLLWVVVQVVRALGSPLDRWGSQRWQRPPPGLASLSYRSS
jgi:hypothetical protein